MKALTLGLFLLAVNLAAQAAVQSKAIEYKDGDTTLTGHLYWNDDVQDPRPGILVIHEWWGLPAAPEEAKGKIGPRILVLHGQADSFVTPEVVDNFRTKLEEAGADWEMDIYGGVRHGFTYPDAGTFGIENLAYDQRADERSWARAQAFFAEIFE